MVHHSLCVVITHVHDSSVHTSCFHITYFVIQALEPWSTVVCIWVLSGMDSQNAAACGHRKEQGRGQSGIVWIASCQLPMALGFDYNVTCNQCESPACLSRETPTMPIVKSPVSVAWHHSACSVTDDFILDIYLCIAGSSLWVATGQCSNEVEHPRPQFQLLFVPAWQVVAQELPRLKGNITKSLWRSWDKTKSYTYAMALELGNMICMCLMHDIHMYDKRFSSFTVGWAMCVIHFLVSSIAAIADGTYVVC